MNKFEIRYILLILTAAFLLPGCSKKWLETKAVKTQTVPSTLSDYQLLLDNVITFNYLSPGLAEIASDGHYITDATWSASTSNTERNAYTWSHSYSYIQVLDWYDFYSKIFNSNLILDGLPAIVTSGSADQSQLNNIKGQALFHRSESFFELAQIYAPPYDASTASNDLSIPLRLTSDITSPSNHSTVKETYQQIIGDLQLAEGLLPLNVPYVTRPSQNAVFALLARVYLSTRQYDSALVYSNLCLQKYNNLLDYNTLSPSATAIGLLNTEVIFQNVIYTDPYFDFMISGNLIDTTLYNSYNSNDLRKTLFFQTVGSSISFIGNYNSTSTGQLFNGLATDEIYLIRAECYARAGNTGAAMADLNTLLQKRWKAGLFSPFTASSADDALNQVLTERKKELLMRGLRWTDLRRLNKEQRFAITLNRTIGGSTYSLAPNSPQYTFPIPDDVIQSTGMKQNPGW